VHRPWREDSVARRAVAKRAVAKRAVAKRAVAKRAVAKRAVAKRARECAVASALPLKRLAVWGVAIRVTSRVGQK